MTYFVVFLCAVVCVSVGFIVGYVVGADPNEPPIEGITSMHGDPRLSYWFRLRSLETDPYWHRMTLREYARRKKLLTVEDEVK